MPSKEKNKKWCNCYAVLLQHNHLNSIAIVVHDPTVFLTNFCTLEMVTAFNYSFYTCPHFPHKKWPQKSANLFLAIKLCPITKHRFVGLRL